jgi:antitoxin ParD1/3/4
MNVALSPELEELVDSKVNSGHYGSASAVVSDALQLLDEWDRMQEARLVELKRDVRRGLEQLDRGESAPLDIEAIKAKARLQRQCR